MNPEKKKIFCVGTAKSGTHSIHSIFQSVSKSAHEPENSDLIKQITDFYYQHISEKDFRVYLRTRYQRLNLDVDSSQLNFFILFFLLEEVEHAYYILTIRDCYTWLDSFINHSLAFPAAEKWIRLRDIRFGKRYNTLPKEEKALMDLGLYSLEGYLQYWAKHNQKVISLVPENKLLIIKTDKISESIQKISDFSGYQLFNVTSDQTHVFKNPQKFNILRKINEEYLEEKVKKYCSILMEQYFPEIKSINDVF